MNEFLDIKHEEKLKKIETGLEIEPKPETYAISGSRRYRDYRKQAGLVLRSVAQEKALERAEIDEVTGLKNRRAFQRTLNLATNRTSKNGGHLALIVLDADYLKLVNDTLGHASGDLLLRVAGEAAVGSVRTLDYVFRIGGDEFGIPIERAPDDEEKLETIAERIRTNTDRALRDSGLPVERFGLGVSVGYAHYQRGMSAEQLLANADEKMYREKNARKQEQP